MKRPSFQFYPGDWQSSSNLRRCTHAEKGAWVDIMCLMHDQPEYGILRWPLKDIAQTIGCSVAMLKALQSKGVLKGDDKQLDEPFIYTPRSGRKDGEPVTLVPTQGGPVWYSSRMVKDEYVRTIRAEAAGNGETPNPQPNGTPKQAPKASPKPSPKGGLGDGSGDGYGEPIGGGFGPRGSSSSSSTSVEESIDKPRVEAAQPAAEAVAPGPPQGPEEVELFGHPPPEHAPSTAAECPQMAIVTLYHQHLPIAKRIRSWNGARPTNLRARWREDRKRQDLAWWEGLFKHIAANCRFLWGKPWFGLDWLVKLENFNKVIEGNYDDREERAA